MEQEEQEQGDPNPDPNANPNPCPICLGVLAQDQDVYLDRCFHKFCYQCIVRWTQVVSSRSSYGQTSSVKCPLCKTENFSIIYGYDGHTFHQHFLNQKLYTFFSKAHKYRLQCYYTKPGILTDEFKVGHYWKSRRYLQLNKWLEKWIKRELQALLQEEDVDIIMHHILGVIESFSRRHDPKALKCAPLLKQEEFKRIVADAARPFLTARTERFVEEVELFLASGLTVEAYDEAHKRYLGWKKPEETSAHTKINGSEQEPVTPYLHFFDDDSDEADFAEDIQ